MNRITKTSLFATLSYIFMATFVVIAIPEQANAGAIEDFICTLVSWTTGQMATAVATFVIMIMGLMAFFGRMHWGIALIIVIGLTIVFGAGAILEMITGTGYECPAKDAGPIAAALCNVYNALSGAPISAVATLVVIALGVTTAIGISDMNLPKVLIGAVAVVCLLAAPAILKIFIPEEKLDFCSGSMSAASMNSGGGTTDPTTDPADTPTTPATGDFTTVTNPDGSVTFTGADGNTVSIYPPANGSEPIPNGETVSVADCNYISEQCRTTTGEIIPFDNLSCPDTGVTCYTSDGTAIDKDDLARALHDLDDSDPAPTITDPSTGTIEPNDNATISSVNRVDGTLSSIMYSDGTSVLFSDDGEGGGQVRERNGNITTFTKDPVTGNGTLSTNGGEPVEYEAEEYDRIINEFKDYGSDPIVGERTNTDPDPDAGVSSVYRNNGLVNISYSDGTRILFQNDGAGGGVIQERNGSIVVLTKDPVTGDGTLTINNGEPETYPADQFDNIVDSFKNYGL